MWKHYYLQVVAQQVREVTPFQQILTKVVQRSGLKINSKPWHSLLGKLASKAASALPGIIVSIVSWILNRAKEAVGWLSQNLWALIVGVGGLVYTYLVTRR